MSRLPGVGPAVTKARNGGLSGMREPPVCLGESPDLLTDDPNFGIAEPEVMLEAQCALSPGVYCD